MDEYTESFVVAPVNLIRSFYLFLSLGALFVVMLAPLASTMLKCGLVMTLCFLLICSCVSGSLKIYLIEYSVFSGWRLLTDEVTYCVELRTHSVVTRFISILYFTDQDKKNYYVICLGGFLAEFNYRSLRRLLLL
jgi:hypothetical protein